MEEQRNEVLKNLGNWINNVSKNKLATPEEIAALPAVAKVYFENYSFESMSEDVSTEHRIVQLEQVVEVLIKIMKYTNHCNVQKNVVNKQFLEELSSLRSQPRG